MPTVGLADALSRPLAPRGLWMAWLSSSPFSWRAVWLASLTYMMSGH